MRPVSAISQCKWAFTVKQKLKIHLRTNSGEKLLHCSQCDGSIIVEIRFETLLRTHTWETHINAVFHPNVNKWGEIIINAPV